MVLALNNADHNREIAAAIGSVDYAFQPIISTSSLRVHGFEALARVHDAAFTDINALLNASFDAGALRWVEGALLKKANRKFADFPDAGTSRLFCNLDNRVFDDQKPDHSLAEELFGQSGADFARLCLELSERDPIACQRHMARLTQSLARKGARIALDDFGVGVSSLQLLMTIEPHYVKIDRCFIEGVATNFRKQAIVAKMCELGHSLGFFTVAEGVETESDFRMARDLGCNFAQGFHIARPTERLSELATAYGRTVTLRNTPHMAQRVADLLSGIDPVHPDDPLTIAADLFKQHPNLSLLPVVDHERLVQGAILEQDMRRYLLSDYGPSLIRNRSAVPRVGELIRRCPVGDAYGSIESIISSYMASDSAFGMILTTEGVYAGYLTNHALLRLASEREVIAAREQNPLTQLPGNHAINRRIGETLCRTGETTFVFFDFDYFKAFNDVYGFAAGDRALLMFAELLRSLECSCQAFAGHIGGDDFFLVLECGEGHNEIVVRDLCARFASQVANLYSATDRERGGIQSIDRHGDERFFPLLKVSAALLHLPAARAHLTQDMIEAQLAAAKEEAKKASQGIFIVRLPESAVAGQLNAIAETFQLGHDSSFETGCNDMDCSRERAVRSYSERP